MKQRKADKLIARVNKALGDRKDQYRVTEGFFLDLNTIGHSPTYIFIKVDNNLVESKYGRKPSRDSLDLPTWKKVVRRWYEDIRIYKTGMLQQAQIDLKIKGLFARLNSDNELLIRL